MIRSEDPSYKDSKKKKKKKNSRRKRRETSDDAANHPRYFLNIPHTTIVAQSHVQVEKEWYVEKEGDIEQI